MRMDETRGGLVANVFQNLYRSPIRTATAADVGLIVSIPGALGYIV
jgi:hypothetical protein